LNKRFIESVTGIQVSLVAQQKQTNVIINDSIVPNYIYTISNHTVNPLFVVADKGAFAMGSLKDSAAVAFARKNFTNHTSWFMSLPSNSPELWRYIFKQAGANIYDANGDIFYSGRGILSVHTLPGGNREIRLQNGKVITKVLPPNSTTLLDPQTGETIMQ
jgi:hypothetical protein